MEGSCNKEYSLKYQSQQVQVLIIQKVQVFGGRQKGRQEKLQKYAPFDLEGNKNTQKIVNDTCIYPNYTFK